MCTVKRRHREVKELISGDFAVDGIACRWQDEPNNTLDSARQWLGDIAGDAVADGLHRDARGRPRLPAGMGDVGWSHSGTRMLLAYAANGHIGVDIELLARRADALRIARRYFAPSEIARLESLGEAARATTFVQLWCAKEAVLKAHGHGIGFGLARVTFDCAGETPRMTDCDAELGNVADWRLHAFAPEPGYLAVLAHHDGILGA